MGTTLVTMNPLGFVSVICATIAFLPSLVALVAAALYGIDQLRGMSPLEVSLLKMILIGSSIATTVLLFISILVVTLGLPKAAKKDCEKQSGAGACTAKYYKEFTGKEGSNEFGSGAGMIVACIA